MAKERTLMVRLSEEQHRAVRVQAAELGISMAQIVRELLNAWLGGRVKLGEFDRQANKEV